MIYKKNEEFFNTNPLISVIVPVYNEEECIDEVLSRLIRLKKIMSMEIIVIDDGSSDNTINVINKYSSILFIKHKKNYGKGAAIKSGINNSKGKIIIIQDADLEYPPEQIQKLATPILKGEANVVYGSRFLGEIEGMSITHTLGNRILSLISQICYGKQITDVMTGHKAFTKEVLNSVEINEKGFEVEVEVTSKILKKGYDITEIPIAYKYREKGVSKIKYRHGIKSLIKLLSIRISTAI